MGAKLLCKLEGKDPVCSDNGDNFLNDLTETVESQLVTSKKEDKDG